ncbi:hypothetical protein [Enterococcus lemanii]|uniref:Bacterial archaeo-eukaryotic release factor family 6 domain-containing protein n=1 Tax=Enterococcus lemanii TaxID=1159752 RepID=A0ABV9MXF6_9ENTE|nr:hypothetical protein [Enterococcus lemanii]MBM7708341.1 hypothetical protein [Enterococcus lemanii]
MAKIGRELLNRLASDQVKGPFVTVMLNTHVAHQEIEKDILKFKNFIKEAKKRYTKRYPDLDWNQIQTKADAILNSADFWRNTTKSIAIILTPEETLVHHLNIEVDDQYYVGDTPYLLAIIKNAQYNYDYYLLALNRDSMSLYKMENNRLNTVELPEEAPTTLKKALGEEITGGGANFRSSGNASGSGQHGTSDKEEEVAIDWANYYIAIGDFLRNFIEKEEKLPLYLFGLPENQAMFKKYAKNIVSTEGVGVPLSPTSLSVAELSRGAEIISIELAQKQISNYKKLIEAKYYDQLADIKQTASLGRISQLFIATSNLVPGFGENVDEEYDWRQELNTIAIDVINHGGEVSLLDQADAPGQKALIAILRY